MKPEFNEIRDQQRTTWNRFSAGWKKWDDFTMNFLKPMGNAIIEELQVNKNDIVLDIASGTGEPALTIAGITTKGKVTATDLAEQMLETAKENAQQKGLKNFETVIADAGNLPFNDESFDKVSCRMGFMFFPDMQLSANEMFRVLKGSGRMATSVWFNPQKNIWTTAIQNIISTNMQIPPPPQGAPSMFRCAAPGFIKTVLEKSGFKNIKEKEINGKVNYVDFEQYWTIMNDVAAPVVSALSKADDNMRKKIKDETAAVLKPYQTLNGLELEFDALIISCEK